jgi:hypothetical protein
MRVILPMGQAGHYLRFNVFLDLGPRFAILWRSIGEELFEVPGLNVLVVFESVT